MNDGRSECLRGKPRSMQTTEEACLPHLELSSVPTSNFKRGWGTAQLCSKENGQTDLVNSYGYIVC